MKSEIIDLVIKEAMFQGTVGDSFEKIPKTEIKKFVKYFMDFYDEEKGLYPIKDLTEQDIIKGIKLRLKERSDMPFDGDSSDRELIRDIVLRWRKDAPKKKSTYMPSGEIKTIYALNKQLYDTANKANKLLNGFTDEIQGGITEENKNSVLKQIKICEDRLNETKESTDKLLDLLNGLANRNTY